MNRKTDKTKALAAPVGKKKNDDPEEIIPLDDEEFVDF